MSDLHTEEELVEFKADMDPSQIEDPVETNPSDKKKEAGARDQDQGGEVKAHEPPTSKVGMINAMVKSMNKMSKDDLQASYKKIMSGMKYETSCEEVEAHNVPKIDASDIDVTEELNAIFGSQDLSEEFLAKATDIFETAVVVKVNELVEAIALENDADLEASKLEYQEELSNNVDKYLEYVVEAWVEENRVAVEQGIRAEMVEGFLTGLKGLFEEHYVDIPEEKVEVIEELVAKVEELENDLNNITESNVELKNEVVESKKELCIIHASKDLTETQATKLRSLAEAVVFESEEDFISKVEMIKGHYFSEEVEIDSEITDDSNNPVALDEEESEVTGNMAAYMNAISKTIKK